PAQQTSSEKISVFTSVEEIIIGAISNELGYSAESIDLDEELDKLGLDSVGLVNVINELEKSFIKLPKTLFFEYRNLKEIIEFITEEYSGIISQFPEQHGQNHIGNENNLSSSAQNQTMKTINSQQMPGIDLNEEVHL